MSAQTLREGLESWKSLQDYWLGIDNENNSGADYIQLRADILALIAEERKAERDAVLTLKLCETNQHPTMQCE